MDALGAIIAIIAFFAILTGGYYVVSRLMERSQQRRANQRRDE